jgi:endo-1,4-beta-xylanase
MDVLYRNSCAEWNSIVAHLEQRVRIVRHFAVFFVLAGFAASVAPQTLRQAADQAGLLVGTAVRPSQLSEPAYSSTLAREFNMVEAEDAMKWWVLRPSQDSYDFRQGDQLVAFAQAHGMKVRGHCLVWGRSNPDWLTQGHFSSAELSKLLHEHIDRVMKHYAGEVFAWDVINEALDEKGQVRESIWYDQPGIGLSWRGMAYIEQVFRWAHKADPQALLFYNEAEGEEQNHKSDAIYAMIKQFKQRGVPIDGVGLQLHIPALAVDVKGLETNIVRLTALGLQVHITELDISLAVDSSGRASAEDLARQAEIYGKVVRACLISIRGSVRIHGVAAVSPCPSIEPTRRRPLIRQSCKSCSLAAGRTKL